MKLGLDNIRAYNRPLTEKLWKEIPKLGYPTLTPPDNDTPIVSFIVEKPGALRAKLKKANVALNDTLLWWVAGGIDAIELFAKAVETSGSTDGPGIIAYLNAQTKYPGYFGNYSWSPTQHNGYPTRDVVMSAANSEKDGAFSLAPGYAM